VRTAARPNGVVPPHITVPLSAYVVDCAVYVKGQRLPGRWSHDRAVREVRSRDDAFVWIGLHEPDDEQITGIADTFGLHELAVEDAVHAHNRPKLERYEDMLFAVFKTVCYVGHAPSSGTASELVETGEVMAFVGDDFVVTVTEATPILAHAPHLNAAKVFVNWLLSKEGQSAVTKALGQPTRRFDVDTKWTKEFGHPAAKEVLTPERFDELENSSEDVVAKFRKPAMQLAERMFK